MELTNISKSNKISILFFINSLRNGGAEKVLVNLVNQIDKSKYNVTVLTLFNKGINKKFLNRDITYEYIFKYKIYGIRQVFKFISPKFLHKILIKDKYDIEISYLHGITTRIIAGGMNNKPKIAWIHGTFNKDFHSKSYYSPKEMIVLYKRFDAIVGVSNRIINSFRKETDITKSTFIIHNTHDVNTILQKSQEKNTIEFDKQTLNFITVGSFVQVKGYERLLRCILKLKLDGYRFHLYFLGAGKLENRLTKFTENNNLSNSITFCGSQVNPYKFLKLADMYICSSYSEGFSGTVSEATILGLPTLTTDCSGMDEILGKNNEYGIIVDNSDEALYKGLKNILDHPEILNYYKKKVKERSSFFNTEYTVKQVENLFDSLVKREDNV